MLILFSPPAAAADGLGDNPAFCFGFLSAQSEKETSALWPRKPQIRSLFAKFGPKDSTDERGFDDWEKVGRDITSDRKDKRYVPLLENCKRFLDAGVN